MENQQLHSHYPSEDRSLLSRAVNKKIRRAEAAAERILRADGFSSPSI